MSQRTGAQSIATLGRLRGGLNGRVIRAYRMAVALNQSEFADRVGITQGALSLWESGKTAISASSADRLWRVFDAPPWTPTLSAFIEKQAAAQRPTASLPVHDSGSYQTLLVWRWTPDLDLGDDPSSFEVRGIVTVRMEPGIEALALELPPQQRYQRGEIAVFRPKTGRDFTPGGLYLIQKVGAGRVVIAEHGGTAKRRGRLRARWPAAGDLTVTEDDVVLGCTFRGRYVPS
jgi:transcriptional regulator with XRE-family HTH domain